MDLILNFADEYFFTPFIYPASWEPTDPLRQLLSLFAVFQVGFVCMYFGFGTWTYYLVFDHNLKKHPQFQENQVKREIITSLKSIPVALVPSTAILFAQVRGFSKLYDEPDENLWFWFEICSSSILFVLFNDMSMYWVHRSLHHRSLYKHFHKTHHKWKIPTPFASYSTHPVDGFLQGLPYYIYPFIFPILKATYVLLLLFINIWLCFVHDGNYWMPQCLVETLAGPAHHADHHQFFNCNYGHHFTLWDKIAGSYHRPTMLQLEVKPQKTEIFVESQNVTNPVKSERPVSRRIRENTSRGL